MVIGELVPTSTKVNIVPFPSVIIVIVCNLARVGRFKLKRKYVGFVKCW